MRRLRHYSMPNPPFQVYIVDDDPSICTAYARLVRSEKMQPRTFASVEDFVGSQFTDENACVICDVHLPGKSGLELPALLNRAGHHLPVLFVTAHETAETRAMAQRSGASAYFRKPVDDQALLDSIVWAISGQARRIVAENARG